MRFWAALAIVSLAVGGCGKPRPKVSPEPTVLRVPSPPPRVVVPPEPDPEPDELVEPLPDKGASRPSRRTPPRTTEVKPDPKAKESAPPATEPARPPVPAPPGASLQPVLPTSPGEVERQVREQLQRASRDLNGVNYGALSADARAQYDMAKRFIEQAGQALTDRNLVFAGKLAEKAANIAAVLLGR